VDSSGSLIRLLDSLKKADFFASAPPRLTIELPHKIDEPTKRYLEQFKCPPQASQNSGNMLSLHHRIPEHGLTPEENSIRFIESFWPADPVSSHVVVLSPQVELSRLFFHYLKYTMLEYRYGGKGYEHDNLLGISLDLPSTYLNDSTTFTVPVLNESTKVTSFLWQAPNSNAALYFGEKWVELHDFVSRVLTSERTLSTAPTEKIVSKTFPSWMEHVLKLARARGYWMLYPNFEHSDALATLHNELFHLPEEYSEPEPPPPSGELTADPATHLSSKHKELPLVTTSLLNILPLNGSLPQIADIPLLTWDGTGISIGEIGSYAVNYSKAFRYVYGGCDLSAREKPRVEFTTSDLFCLDDIKEE
jgi:hypothetical protein